MKLTTMSKELCRTDFERMSTEKLFELEDILRILRDDSFGETREEYEEILFDVRVIRKLRSN